MSTFPVTICLFAKPPLPGQAKTRLGAVLGDSAAAALARAFLADTLRDLRSFASCGAERQVVLATTSTIDTALLPWSPPQWLQGDGDLGARMERVMRRALEDRPGVVAVGADSPGRPARLLEQACAALSQHDAVIGPSSDGGFYLLGLRECPDGLLADLPWSAPDTFVQTLARLRHRGRRVAVLDPWFDVDSVRDLAVLRRELEQSRVVAPATASVLSSVALPPAPWLSVVVPVLDEAARLGPALDHLRWLPGVDEVLVVDGGSSDETVASAVSRAVDAVSPRISVLSAPRGRASQQNFGARAATGEVLLFLHADVGLPRDAVRWIDEALSDDGVVAGAFRTWTVDDTGTSRLGPLLHLADVRSRYTGVPYGDQAIFMRRGEFLAIGGFPDLPLMEDLELGLRLRRAGRVRTVPAEVRVSGRRFVARPVWYTAVVNVFPALYRVGVPARLLARLYRAVR